MTAPPIDLQRRVCRAHCATLGLPLITPDAPQVVREAAGDAARHAGLSVPGDLSVIGFDDFQIASRVWPPLTTIHQPMFDLAHTATEILIAGGDINHRRLPHTLVERASVAPPARKTS